MTVALWDVIAWLPVREREVEPSAIFQMALLPKLLRFALDTPAALVVIATNNGIRRGPAVALALAGLLRRQNLVDFADVFVFPVGSRDFEPPAWTDEANRLAEFLQSGRPVWL